MSSIFILHSRCQAAAEYNDVRAFESHHGAWVRSIPEYCGLSFYVLRSVLAKRSAFALATEEWVDVPILVSRKVAENWTRKFGCHARPRIESVPVGTQPSNYTELEQLHGVDLRRNVALGFVGRRAAEKYLRERGVNASEEIVRKWYDLYSRRIPEGEGEAISSDSEGFSDVEPAAVSCHVERLRLESV